MGLGLSHPFSPNLHEASPLPSALQKKKKKKKPPKRAEEKLERARSRMASQVVCNKIRTQLLPMLARRQFSNTISPFTFGAPQCLLHQAVLWKGAAEGCCGRVLWRAACKPRGLSKIPEAHVQATTAAPSVGFAFFEPDVTLVLSYIAGFSARTAIIFSHAGSKPKSHKYLLP